MGIKEVAEDFYFKGGRNVAKWRSMVDNESFEEDWKEYNETHPSKTLIDELQDLYDHEINFKIECFWDGGFRVCIGDDMNGFPWVGCGFETLEKAIEKLIKEAENK